MECSEIQEALIKWARFSFNRGLSQIIADFQRGYRRSFSICDKAGIFQEAVRDE
jgi:hypothetical protein